MKKINGKYFLTFTILLFIWNCAIVVKGQSAEENENKPAKNWSYKPSVWCRENVPVKYWLTTKQMSSIMYTQCQCLFLPNQSMQCVLHGQGEWLPWCHRLWWEPSTRGLLLEFAQADGSFSIHRSSFEIVETYVINLRMRGSTVAPAGYQKQRCKSREGMG